MSDTTALRFIDLLRWAAERRLIPAPTDGDQVLCPLTRKLGTYRRLRPHQRRSALTIPTAKQLRALGIEVDVRDLGELKHARTHRFHGAGSGEAEAILSMLNAVRMARAC